MRYDCTMYTVHILRIPTPALSGSGSRDCSGNTLRSQPACASAPWNCRAYYSAQCTRCQEPRASFLQTVRRCATILRRHRAIASARSDRSFAPILRFEKLEIRTVILHVSNLDLTKKLSSNLFAKLCGVALKIRWRNHMRLRIGRQYPDTEKTGGNKLGNQRIYTV
mgnify:CR=1 FL=1